MGNLQDQSRIKFRVWFVVWQPSDGQLDQLLGRGGGQQLLQCRQRQRCKPYGVHIAHQIPILITMHDIELHSLVGIDSQRMTDAWNAGHVAVKLVSVGTVQNAAL